MRADAPTFAPAVNSNVCPMWSGMKTSGSLRHDTHAPFGVGGCGVSAGFTVATVAEYEAALDAALATPGPAVIDVRIDATGYARQLQAARG